MTLSVHPDPQQPAGGFAFLELPEGSVTDSTATVAVFDAYGERWLAADEEAGARVGIGDPHWQSERFEFGPYPVYRHEGADWVRIGPEIVNKIEEYVPLKISVAGASYDVSWPDDVPPRAGAAVLGGLQPVKRPTVEEDESHLVGRVEPEEEPEVLELAADTVVPPSPPAEAERGRKIPVWPFLLLLLLLAGVAAWWFWPRETVVRAGEAEAVAVDTVQVANADACTADALGAIEGGFQAVGAAIRACGQGVSADLALSLVEDYAERDDPDALFLFGTLYDGQVQDEQIETLIGLTFADDDARAAEYYARAAKVGSETASEKLEATCTRLAGSSSTLAKGAYDDFCG